MTRRTVRCPEGGGRRPPYRGTCQRLICAALLALLCGCSIDVLRVREQTLDPHEKENELRVGETTLGETLTKLGAPTRLEWKNGKDYLWYDAVDRVDVGLAFRLPTPIFGYRHTLMRLRDAQSNTNSLQLVFDEEEVLLYKRLRLAEAFEEAEPDAPEASKWKLHVRPRAGYSFMMLGDGGEEDYSDLFDNGYRAGLDIAFQPFPIATLLIGGSYQRHGGERLDIGGSDVEFDDLELFDVQAGVRVSLPFRIFSAFLGEFQEVKKIVFDDDLDRPAGLRLYVQGTTGAGFNNDVEVKIDGVKSGDFYDDDIVLTSTAEAGVEYGWGWGTAYIGMTYQRIQAFEEGDSPLDGDGSGLQTVMVTGGLGLRF